MEKETADHRIIKMKNIKGMGTTLEAVAVTDDQVLFAHVGDSSEFSDLMQWGIPSIDSDHSLVNALLKADRLRKKRQSSSNAISSPNPLDKR